ncbi:MAG: LuxR C-terminal-related transcriptional regulator [Actinomycetota bacterium]|nr:LuxR C-terminal-related transcriptional regulator [Actinomycetota bacterium]MCL6092413.1 LuxR C-terminal-related transcriptional regulator [Actinomycetota bacterium]MDA8168026.1 LuxR C-terminal-related transcriptional regulator [Actinomycetota bacterium]
MPKQHTALFTASESDFFYFEFVRTGDYPDAKVLLTTLAGTKTKNIPDGKLKPPRLQYVLSRPRLEERIHLAEGQRLVAICAGAGFGKTTLMAQMAKGFPGAFLWYQVDELDRDPAIFFGNLIAGLSGLVQSNSVQGVAGGISKTQQREKMAAEKGSFQHSLERLREAKNVRNEAETIMACLVEEIKAATSRPLKLFFDDFHWLDGSDFPSLFVDFMIRNLPANVALILASRTKPRLPSGSLRGSSLISELNEDDLRFSRDETERLLTDTWLHDLDPEDVDRLHKNIEGWATGLVLAEDQIRAGNKVPELFSAKRQMRKNVFEYLTEEVLKRQAADLQNLLILSSLIDPVDPSICEAALELQDPQALLDKAVRLNLFTARIEGTPLYRFHPLFREFLLTRLAGDRPENEIRELRHSFGRAFEDASNSKKAVEQYLAGGYFHEASAVLEKIWSDMLGEAQYETLLRWLMELEQIDLPPALLICYAQVLMVGARYEKALEKLRSVEHFLGEDDIELRCRSGISISECLLEIGDLDQSLERLEECLQFVGLRPSIKFELLYALCQCHWYRYDDKAFDKYLKEAKLLANMHPSLQLADQVAVISSMNCLRRGEFKKAEKLLDDALRSKNFSAAKKNLYTNNFASCMIILGSYDQAAELAENCLRTVNEQKERKSLSVILDTYGCALYAMGKREEGLARINEAMLVGSSFESENVEKRMPVGHLGTIARRSGDYYQAYRHHSQCAASALKSNDKYLIAMSEANLAADAMQMNNIDEANERLNKAENLSKKHGFGYILTQIDIHSSWLAYQKREMNECLERLASGLARARKNQQNHFIIQEGKICLPLFTTALAKDIESDYVMWVLEKMGASALIAVEPLLKHSDMQVRINAVTVIGNLGDTDGITPLRKIYHDEDPFVQEKVRATLKILREKIKAPSNVLTNREEQILSIIATGASNGQIAKKLFISELTVKTHINRIFKKLGLTNGRALKLL